MVKKNPKNCECGQTRGQKTLLFDYLSLDFCLCIFLSSLYNQERERLMKDRDDNLSIFSGYLQKISIMDKVKNHILDMGMCMSNYPQYY
jgi:hypothetical protein